MSVCLLPVFWRDKSWRNERTFVEPTFGYLQHVRNFLNYTKTIHMYDDQIPLPFDSIKTLTG